MNSREEMGVLLWRRRRFLADYARTRLPADATDEMVDAIVDRAGERLLAIAEPRFDDGEDHVRRVVREECTRWLRAPDPTPSPPAYDPVLRRQIVGPVLEAFRKISPRQQGVIWKVAHDHLSYAEIAEQEGVAEGTVRVHAHRGRQTMLQELRKAGHVAPAFFLLGPRRVRVGLTQLVEGFAPQSFATTALIPLLMLFASPPPLALPASPPVVRQETAPAGAQRAPAVLAIASPHPDQLPGPAAIVASTSEPRLAPRLTGAAAETPDDVVLTAVASPADGRPVLVAIGNGRTCRCPVLMRSLDGGADWESTDGPPLPLGVNQLVVPPTYPRDSRIFAGVSPVLGGSPYMAAGFGQAFTPLSALPPGQVAVSAHFDDGDPRVFVAGQTAVWSIRMGDTSPVIAHAEVDYPAPTTAGIVAALATPAPSRGGPALMAWVPPLAVAPGAPTAMSADSSFAQCPVTSPCSVVGTLPILPWRMEAQGSTTVLAYTAASAYVSRDGGVTFVPLSLPRDVSTLDSIALSGTGFAPWISFHRGDKTASVARLLPSGSWVDESAGSDAARTSLGLLVPVGTDRMIEEFTTVGYRCTTITGGAWAPRCPAQ